MAQRPPLPLAKKLLFAAVPLLALLLVATLGLRAMEQAGLIHTERDGDRVLYLADDYLRSEQAADGERFLIMDAQYPEVVQASVVMPKPAGTFRIVVVGGSFARGEHTLDAGVPLQGYGSIPSWMQELLRHRYPSQPIEVVNAGGSAQSSFAVRESVERLLAADPDLVVVATGANEGTLPPTPFNQALHEWVLYRAMKRGILGETPPEERPMLQPQEHAAVELRGHYTTNLRAIATTCRKAGVGVAFVTLPVNLLGYAARIDVMQIGPAAREGLALCEQGSLDPGLERINQGDDTVEMLLASARCLLQAGEHGAAAEVLGSAIEQDPRGTARPSLNAEVRAMAARFDAPLVDLEAALNAESHHGLAGETFFWDHLHLTSDGYLWVAREIVNELGEAGKLPAEEGEPLAEPSLEAMLEARGWGEIYEELRVAGR